VPRRLARMYLRKYGSSEAGSFGINIRPKLVTLTIFCTLDL
jgi:hypothetical protein